MNSDDDAPPLIRVETLRVAALRGGAEALGGVVVRAPLSLTIWVLLVPGMVDLGLFAQMAANGFAYGLAAAPVALVELHARSRLPAGGWVLRHALAAWGVAAVAVVFAHVSVGYAGGMLSGGSPAAGYAGALSFTDWEPKRLVMTSAYVLLGTLPYGLLVLLRLREAGLALQAALVGGLTAVISGALTLPWLVPVGGVLSPQDLAYLLLTVLTSGIGAAVTMPLAWRLADRLAIRWWGPGADVAQVAT